MAAAVVDVNPAPVDLVGVRAGDDTSLVVLIHNAGTPIDLTGCTVSAQARKTASDPLPAITAACTVTDAPGGQALVTWDGTDVSGLMPTPAVSWDGVWDLQLADTGGVIRTVAAGKFGAVMDVTRP
jgi:hypothetical protein